MSLSEFVKNKRVAVVGPASYLEGKNFGKLIDDYDVVVRPNYFHMLPHLKKDYGTRTDILFHNFGTEWMNGLKDNIRNNQKEFDEIKMMVCPVLYGTRGKEENYMSWPEDHVGDVVHNAKSINENQVPFEWIGVKKYQEFYNAIGCQPYTGVLSVLMLLECPLKELYLTGFDFYGTDKVYVDGFQNPLDGPPPNRGGSHGGDSSVRQKKYLRDVYSMSNHFEVDDRMRELFS